MPIKFIPKYSTITNLLSFQIKQRTRVKVTDFVDKKINKVKM